MRGFAGWLPANDRSFRANQLDRNTIDTANHSLIVEAKLRKSIFDDGRVRKVAPEPNVLKNFSRL